MEWGSRLFYVPEPHGVVGRKAMSIVRCGEWRSLGVKEGLGLFGEREKLLYDRGKPHAASAHALRHACELATEGEVLGGLPGRGNRMSKGTGLELPEFNSAVPL